MPPPLKNVVTGEHEEMLWSSRHLNMDTSIGLIQAVIFYLIKCFGLWQGKDLKLLKTEHVTFSEDMMGSFVAIDVKMAVGAGKVVKRYDDPGNPRSVYKIIRTYKGYLANEGPFLVRPISSIKDYICYSPWPLGLNIIEQTVVNLMQECGIGSGFGNVSVCLMAIDILKSFGAGSHCISTWILRLYPRYKKTFWFETFKECSTINCEDKNLEACLVISHLLDPPYPTNTLLVEMRKKQESLQHKTESMDAWRTKIFNSWISNINSNTNSQEGLDIMKKRQELLDAKKRYTTKAGLKAAGIGKNKLQYRSERVKNIRNKAPHDLKSSPDSTSPLSSSSVATSLIVTVKEEIMTCDSSENNCKKSDVKIMSVLSIPQSAYSAQVDEGESASHVSPVQADEGESASHVSHAQVDEGESASDSSPAQVDEGESASHASPAQVDEDESASHASPAQVDEDESASDVSSTLNDVTSTTEPSINVASDKRKNTTHKSTIHQAYINIAKGKTSNYTCRTRMKVKLKYSRSKMSNARLDSCESKTYKDGKKLGKLTLDEVSLGEDNEMEVETDGNEDISNNSPLCASIKCEQDSESRYEVEIDGSDVNNEDDGKQNGQDSAGSINKITEFLESVNVTKINQVEEPPIDHEINYEKRSEVNRSPSEKVNYEQCKNLSIPIKLESKESILLLEGSHFADVLKTSTVLPPQSSLSSHSAVADSTNTFLDQTNYSIENLRKLLQEHKSVKNESMSNDPDKEDSISCPDNEDSISCDEFVPNPLLPHTNLQQTACINNSRCSTHEAETRLDIEASNLAHTNLQQAACIDKSRCSTDETETRLDIEASNFTHTDLQQTACIDKSRCSTEKTGIRLDIAATNHPPQNGNTVINSCSRNYPSLILSSSSSALNYTALDKKLVRLDVANSLDQFKSDIHLTAEIVKFLDAANIQLQNILQMSVSNSAERCEPFNSLSISNENSAQVDKIECQAADIVIVDISSTDETSKQIAETVISNKTNMCCKRKLKCTEDENILSNAGAEKFKTSNDNVHISKDKSSDEDYPLPKQSRSDCTQEEVLETPKLSLNSKMSASADFVTSCHTSDRIPEASTSENCEQRISSFPNPDILCPLQKSVLERPKSPPAHAKIFPVVPCLKASLHHTSLKARLIRNKRRCLPLKLKTSLSGLRSGNEHKGIYRDFINKRKQYFAPKIHKHGQFRYANKYCSSSRSYHQPHHINFSSSPSSSSSMLLQESVNSNTNSGFFFYRSNHQENAAYQKLQINHEKQRTHTFRAADIPLDVPSSRSPESCLGYATSEICLGDYFPEGTVLPMKDMKLVTQQGLSGLEVLLNFEYKLHSKNVAESCRQSDKSDVFAQNDNKE